MVLVLSLFAIVAVVAVRSLRGRGREGLGVRELVGASPPEERTPLSTGLDGRVGAVPALDRLLRRLSVARRLELLLYRAGVGIGASAFLLLAAACALLGWVVAASVFRDALHGAVMFGALGSAPFLVVSYKKSVRQHAIAEELPAALDLLVGALGAGSSLPAALRVVAEQAPEPVRSEFAIVVKEHALGRELREALADMASRVGSPDLKFFVTSVALQRSAGGNLIEAIENTSRLIRDRTRILGEIATLTAQGRATGAIVSAAPFVVALFVLIVAPGSLQKMWNHPAARTLLGFAFLMQLLGWVTIRDGR